MSEPEDKEIYCRSNPGVTMQHDNAATRAVDDTEAWPPPEIAHIPRWVISIVVVAVILFATQLPSFPGVLMNAVQKSRADDAYDHAQYAQAISFYRDLHDQYPTEIVLIKRLGFSYYRTGQYLEAMDTFSQLVGRKLCQSDVTEINAAIADIAQKLNRKAR